MAASSFSLITWFSPAAKRLVSSLRSVLGRAGDNTTKPAPGTSRAIEHAVLEVPVAWYGLI